MLNNEGAEITVGFIFAHFAALPFGEGALEVLELAHFSQPRGADDFIVIRIM